jgi:hypothetical protein
MIAIIESELDKNATTARSVLNVDLTRSSTQKDSILYFNQYHFTHQVPLLTLVYFSDRQIRRRIFVPMVQNLIFHL